MNNGKSCTLGMSEVVIQLGVKAPFCGVFNAGLVFQSSRVATLVDVALQEGLDILIQDKNVLSCWSDRWDAIWYAELGSSWAVLNAGFNIDCMISRSAALSISVHVWHLC